MSFYLSGTADEKLRLKSYTSSGRNARMTIRIEVETSDPLEFGWALQKLAAVQKGQRAKPEKPKPKPKVKPLALPAPQLALPKPEDPR